MSTSSQLFEAYLPDYDQTPEKWEEARVYLVEQLKKINTQINEKQIGFYLDQELLSGNSFIPDSLSVDQQQFRAVFRVVVVFGALPNATAKSVAHNITVDANFQIVKMWLAASDPVGLTGFALSYYSIAAADIKLNYTSTNVVVTTNSDYSSFTKCYVVMEYANELIVT